jgi:hypothetical protein
MSATEIIAEIKKLPREEQQKIVLYLDEVKKEIGNQPGTGVSEQFKRTADEVFKTNAELFKKLAQ